MQKNLDFRFKKSKLFESFGPELQNHKYTIDKLNKDWIYTSNTWKFPGHEYVQLLFNFPNSKRSKQIYWYLNTMNDVDIFIWQNEKTCNIILIIKKNNTHHWKVCQHYRKWGINDMQTRVLYPKENVIDFSLEYDVLLTGSTSI